MSSSTVVFRGAEFVVNDLYIEVWLLEVVRQIENEQVVEPWLKELKDEWRLQATSGFGFGVCPTLDFFVGDEVRRERMVQLFLKSLKALSSRSDAIPPEELDRSCVGGPGAYYSGDLPTVAVIEVGRQFLVLLS